MNQNPADDYFVQSHGVKTPDATRKNLDRYLVTVDEIERITGEKIPVAAYAKHDKPSASWLIPHGCNKG